MDVYLFIKLLVLQGVVVPMTGESQYELSTLVNNDSEVILECFSTYAKLNLSIWRRREIIIYNGGRLNPVYPQGERFSITGNRAKGEYFLKISNLTEDDQGSYKCETANEEGAVYQYFTVSLGSTKTITTTRGNDLEKDKNRAPIDHTYSEHTAQTTGTSNKYDVEEKLKPTSGQTLNWTLVISGLIGSCLVIVLAMFVRATACIYRKCQSTRAPNGHSLVTQYHEHGHNTGETNSYEYIDENTMMHLHHPSRETDDPDRPRTSAISTRSYMEAFEDPTDIRHSYQSLIENCPVEIPHQYMVIHRPTPYSFLSGLVTPVDTMKLCRNSLDISRKRRSNDSCAIKRSNSWPTGVDKVNRKKSETDIIKLLVWKPTESNNSFKRNNAVTDSHYVDMSSLCETNKDKNNLRHST